MWVRQDRREGGVAGATAPGPGPRKKEPLFLI